MPLNKITVSRTFHLGDSNFFKVGQEGTIGTGETREELTADAMGYIYSTLKKYCPETDIVNPLEPKKELPMINIDGKIEPDHSVEQDQEWLNVVKKLNRIKTKEKAQAYLDTTPYRLVVEAKRIVNNKK